MAETASTPEAPKVPIRSLFLSLLFSAFTALVTFVVASYYFLVPRMAIQSAEVHKLQVEVFRLKGMVAELQPVDEAQPQDADQAAADPAAPADPAAAPADPAAAPADPAAAAPAPAGAPTDPAAPPAAPAAP